MAIGRSDEPGGRIVVWDDHARNAVVVLFTRRDSQGHWVGVCDRGQLMWTQAAEGAALSATLSLDRVDGEMLIAALLDYAQGSGIRISEVEQVRGRLEAQEGHLADMRALVAKTLKVDLPAKTESEERRTLRERQ